MPSNCRAVRLLGPGSRDIVPARTLPRHLHRRDAISLARMPGYIGPSDPPEDVLLEQQRQHYAKKMRYLSDWIIDAFQLRNIVDGPFRLDEFTTGTASGLPQR